MDNNYQNTLSKMKFSQKIGKTQVREKLQIESIDKRLENRLWNTILREFFNRISNFSNYDEYSEKAQVCMVAWEEFFGYRTDEIPSTGGVDVSGVINFIKNWFFQEAEWYEKYDLIEYLARIDSVALHVGFTTSCNNALEKEMAGYRIIDNSIAQITSEEEILEIEQALDSYSMYTSVNTHLRTSIKYFSDRENPSYRNSIKESISAVESLCGIITGYENATLGQALNIVEKKFAIHGALKKAFSNLYGYTSDTGGIRHSLLKDEIEVSFEDAKFVLVSCSAFLNYLRVKIEK